MKTKCRRVMRGEVSGVRKLMAKVLAFAVLYAIEPAGAQVRKADNQLPLALAMEAAAEAAGVCAAQGWPVSVSIIDTAGNVKLQAKGDGSTIHTKDSSYRKAYTVATMGPVFGFDTLGAWVDKLKASPNAAALATIPDIILLPGAVAVRSRGEIVAAIGVGGAPGGEKDEACAAAGLARIRDRLTP